MSWEVFFFMPQGMSLVICCWNPIECEQDFRFVWFFKRDISLKRQMSLKFETHKIWSGANNNNNKKIIENYYSVMEYIVFIFLYVWLCWTSAQYLTLQKYFSQPSSVIYFLSTSPIKKLKLGLQIRGRLLIAKHLDLDNRKQGAIVKSCLLIS